MNIGKVRLSFGTKMLLQWGVILGVLVHGFMMCNKFPNGDDLGQTYDAMSRAASGRWFLQVPARFSSSLSMSWINVLFAVIYIVLATCFVVETFRMKSRLCAGILAFVMLAFPSVSSTFFYYNSADAYFFGMMLACAGAFILCTQKWYWAPAAALCFVLSLGIYQAYLGFAMAVLLAYLVKEVLYSERPSMQILLHALRMLAVIVISLIAYVLVSKWFTRDSGLTRYMGIDTMGKITWSQFQKQLQAAYQTFFEFFVLDLSGFHGSIRYVTPLVAAVTVGLMIFRTISAKIYKDVFRMIALLACVALMPAACNFIYLTNPQQVHTLMRYGLCGLFVLLVAVIDAEWRAYRTLEESRRTQVMRLVCGVLCVLLLIVPINYAVKDNMAYFAAYLSYEQTYAFSTLLLQKVEMVEGFRETDQVWLVGTPQVDNNKRETRWMDQALFKQYTGLPMNMMQNGNAYPRLLHIYLGSPLSIRSAARNDIQDPEMERVLDAMPTYPNGGSIVRLEDGRIVVKFSD